jgi:SHS2 domain-containing protein
MDLSSEHYYRLIDHTADLGMEIFGADPEALFANAARALFAVLVSDGPAAGAERQTRAIDLEGADWADLMVNWLRELLYLWNGEQQVPCRIAIHSLTEHHLRATVGTGDFIPGRHGIDHEIKAVTYHQIQVGPEGDGWRARVIFDV